MIEEVCGKLDYDIRQWLVDSRIQHLFHVVIFKGPLVVREKVQNFRKFVNFPINFQKLRFFLVVLEQCVDDKCRQEMVEYF